VFTSGHVVTSVSRVQPPHVHQQMPLEPARARFVGEPPHEPSVDG